MARVVIARWTASGVLVVAVIAACGGRYTEEGGGSGGGGFVPTGGAKSGVGGAGSSPGSGGKVGAGGSVPVAGTFGSGGAVGTGGGFPGCGKGSLCFGVCTNTALDANNCGGCGIVCPPGLQCVSSTCSNVCGPNQLYCDGACRDIYGDENYCGGCSSACPPRAICSGGSCTSLCADGGAGQQLCGMSCVDTQTDPANCGACGLNCGPQQICNQGVCRQSTFMTFSGVRQNLPIADLLGWSQCHVEAYGDSDDANDTELSEILAKCNRAQLLLGCRRANSSTLLVAAHAPRADVIFNTGDGDVPHDANGVGWYFSRISWGFAPQGAPIDRNSCDVQGTVGQGQFAESRLCWHTSTTTLKGGWRCGQVTDLNESSQYSRVIFHGP